MHLFPDISLLKLLQNFQTFTQSVEAIKSTNLIQMKVLSSAPKVILSLLLELFNMGNFESGKSEENNYKIESFPNEISLHN